MTRAIMPTLFALTLCVTVLPTLRCAQAKEDAVPWQPLAQHQAERPVIQKLEERYRGMPVIEARLVPAQSWAMVLLPLRPQREQMAKATRLRLWVRAADDASVGRTLQFSTKTTDNQRRWQYPRLTAEWTSLEVALTPDLVAKLDVATVGLAKNERPVRVHIAGPQFDSEAPAPTPQPAPIPQAPPRRTVDPATLPVYGGWRSSRIGGGGWMQRVVASPSDPQRFYAYADVAGLYRSDNGGQTWRMLQQNLPHNHIRSLSVDPRNADVLLAAIGKRTWGQGIYRSADGGQTWTRVLQAEFHGNDTPVARAAGVVLARHPRQPDVVLAASRNDGIFRSADGGMTWQNVGVAGQIPQDVVFDRANPDRAWVCTFTDPRWNKEGGLYRSDDAGRTWRKIAAAAPGELVPDPQQDDVLYGLFDETRIERSTDGGMTWTAWSNGLPIHAEAARRNPVNEHRFLALTTGPDFVLTASTRGTLYRLQAGANQWQRLERGAVEQGDWPLARSRTRSGEFDFLGASLSSLTVSPHDPKHWFWTDWFGVYQSHDAGRTWRLSVEGIECTVVHDLLVDPRDPRLVHAGVADIGYLRSTDGGLTFDRGYLPIGQGLNIRMIAAPAQGQRVYAVGSGASNWVADALFVSDDRGRTWRRPAMRGYPTGTARCVAVAVAPQQPRRVALTASGTVGPDRGGVYLSDDGGETFRWIGQGLPEGQSVFEHEIWGGGRHLLMLDDETMIALRRDRPEVFVRGPEADAWKSVTLPGSGRPHTLLAVPGHPAEVFLTVQDHALLHSADRGLTWRLCAEGKIVAAAVAPEGNQLAVWTSDRRIRISADQGRTWRDRETPCGSLPLGPALQWADRDRLVAGSDGNGVFWIDLKNDLGGQ